MKHGKIGLWTLLTDGLLLFLALISTGYGVVTAYHIRAVSSALWVGAAALALAAVGLVNLPQYRFPAMLGTFVLWAWGLWRLWEPLVWGGTRIQCDVVNTIAAKVPGVTGIAPVVELPDELWPQVATLWLLMVGAVYALALAFLLCRLRRGLPVVLWMLLPILPAICVTEAPDSLPMAGMLAVWLTVILTSFTDSRDPSGTARMRPMVLICVLAVLQMTTERLPTQGTAQPVWAADIREAVINEASRGDLSALLSRWSGWIGAGSAEYMNLLGSAPAQTGRVALRVWGEMGKYYLRGYSADRYTGRRWEPLGREAQAELEAIRECGVEPLLMLGEAAGKKSNYEYRSYRNGEVTLIRGDDSAQMTVENVAAPGGCIYYPYALKELPENAAFGGDSHLERTGAVWEHTFTFYPDWKSLDWYNYDLSYRYGQRGAPVQKEPDPYRDFVYEQELQVPEDLRPILEDWLRQGFQEEYGEPLANLEELVRYRKWYEERLRSLIYSSNPRVEEVLAAGPSREELAAVAVTGEDLEENRAMFMAAMTAMVVDKLASTTRYDRNTSAPPAGRDYVDWFLNESKQGYCMHYATAATLLLRTAGIPARYVSGYVAQIPWQMDSVEVTDHAAHAWVEVYIDRVGWYPLEVTPGFQSNGMGDIPALESGNAQASAAPSATPRPSPTPSQAVEEDDEEDDEEEAVPSAAPTPSAEPDGPAGTTVSAAPPIPAGVWYALAALLMVAAAILGRRKILKRRREKLEGEDTNAAVLYAYVCYERLKSWGGEESGELTTLAEKAKFSQHTLASGERERALHILREESRRVYTALSGWKKPFFTLLFGKG